MKLYGTTTSPYVRRVRIAALELGVPCELVDVTTESGQAALRALTPIWKVPIAELAGEIIFDSRAILERLLWEHPRGTIPPPVEGAGRWRQQNLLNVIDGALDAAINTFYLQREGARPE